MTAFDRAGQLNLPPMRRLFRRVADSGIRVLLPCAGSAEFHSLTTDEIVQVLEVARDEVASDVLVIAPAGGAISDVEDSLQRYQSAGADAVLMMPMGFPYMSDCGVKDYLVRVLDSSPLPLLVYKKGPHPSDELLVELASHSNFVGVKYAVNDLDAFRRFALATSDSLVQICGTAERFAPFFMLAGATGFTSGAANLCPRLALAMHAAIEDGDWLEAMQLQDIIRPIEDYRAKDENSYNVSMLKYGLTLTGLDFGCPRPPQRLLTDEEMQQIDQLLASIFQAEHSLETTH